MGFRIVPDIRVTVSEGFRVVSELDELLSDFLLFEHPHNINVIEINNIKFFFIVFLVGRTKRYEKF